MKFKKIKIKSRVRVPSTFSMLAIALFFLMVVLNNLFNESADMLRYSKVVILAFWVVMVVLILRNKRIRVSRQVIFPLAFLVWEVITMLWSKGEDGSVTLLKTEAQLLLLFLFTYLFFLNFASIKIYLSALYISGYALLGYVLIKYDLAEYVTAMFAGRRLGGLIGNENTFGRCFAIAAITAFYFFLYSKQPRFKIFHILSFAVFVFFSLSSGSKKAIIIIIGGVVAMGILKFGIREVGKAILYAVLILAVGFAVLQLPVFQSINQRFFSFLTGDFGVSDQIRAGFIRTGWEYFLNNPFFGYGLSSFSVMSGEGTYSHNNWIELLVSVGAIGFLLYCVPFISSGICLFRGVLKKDHAALFLFVLWGVEVVTSFAAVRFSVKDSWIILAVLVAYADRLRYASSDGGTIGENALKGEDG